MRVIFYDVVNVLLIHWITFVHNSSYNHSSERVTEFKRASNNNCHNLVMDISSYLLVCICPSLCFSCHSSCGDDDFCTDVICHGAGVGAA